MAKHSLITSCLISLSVLGAVAGTIYSYAAYKHNQEVAKNPNAQVQDLVGKVETLIELPQGEQPTVATVSDVTKLANQHFFVHAKDGDKVLIYPKAQKAILYDPNENKIVEVGPVTYDTSSGTQTKTQQAVAASASPTTAVSPTVSVLKK